ncbi:MAG: ABC transporter substrate-binding protein, partial [Pseudomonadota bacterium]
MRADLAGAILLLLGVAWSGQAVAAGHGFALFSELKNPAGFTQFAYANPDAPKGGTLREGSMLTFDSLNPLRFPGNPPNELDLTFDSLMVRAEDEPASYYGLIAERVVLAEDFSSIRFHLRPEARWHDGTQIRANDIAVTFRALRAHGLPGYRAALEGVEITVIDPMTIEFRAGSGGDWLYLDLVATFPIQSARFWAARDVSRPTLDIPTGSGPYRIVALEQNDRVSLQREPGYWGRDLPVNRGRWNFDRIEIVYFRDRTAMIEALKAGRLDINREFDASRWAKAYDGPRLRAGDLVRRSDRERSAGRLDGLVFNLRRPPLDDARVRAALTCAFDADWTR